jgi:hypothetical protein
MPSRMKMKKKGRAVPGLLLLQIKRNKINNDHRHNSHSQIPRQLCVSSAGFLRSPQERIHSLFLGHIHVPLYHSQG